MLYYYKVQYKTGVPSLVNYMIQVVLSINSTHLGIILDSQNFPKIIHTVPQTFFSFVYDYCNKIAHLLFWRPFYPFVVFFFIVL